MGAQQREYRQRSRSVQSTKKITRAMELIAASRVVKARQRVAETTPYARAITHAASAVATHADVDHPLTTQREAPKRAGVLVITSDRGLAGAYAANVLKRSEQLRELVQDSGMEFVPYLTGRKAESYYNFRSRPFEDSWSGFSDSPTFDVAQEISERLIGEFVKGSQEGGFDELHLVYTRFVNMVTQEVQVTRLLPLEVVEDAAPKTPENGFPLYDFEPDAAEVLDALLPRYITSRVWNALLQSAASELAARQRAMKSATDNAEELIKTYTRLANQARQAEITQEISEIVGGASALADAK
ncbi:F0F1 ATP synthase subunit gamma [Serinicoccus sp. CNJ-927]|uniref:F0F1 ATP synthase subunit gamma n=1 Tax=unclassified Serinicoccus TaxID=2643101 RepID=UPI00095CDD03|nr:MULTISPECIES: F0F1 ATP synthase subunit gamma [unclassified Serinicoccus]OLT19221.1 F0F1 ATP synthase subunit gamma [Serinicoccus sp. CUA-874]OLT43457.1 F0F1 ATP synthase subunit gamma [Serinicoccus sp. CNJ-927]